MKEDETKNLINTSMIKKTSGNAQQLHATDRSFQKKPDKKLLIVDGYVAGDYAQAIHLS